MCGSLPGEPELAHHMMYQKINDVYVPSLVREVRLTQDGNGIRFQRILTLEECELNAPISPEVFTFAYFGLENGERVLDRIEGVACNFEDGSLINPKEFHSQVAVIDTPSIDGHSGEEIGFG